MRNTNNLGDLAEIEFVKFCMSKGWIVCRPINSGTIYDFVLETGKAIYKVQIKSCWNFSEGIHIRLHNNATNRSHYNDDCDVMFVYDGVNKDWWILPLEEFEDRKVFKVRNPTNKNCVSYKYKNNFSKL